jgi:hypothetical protein
MIEGFNNFAHFHKMKNKCVNANIEQKEKSNIGNNRLFMTNFEEKIRREE